MYKIILVFLSNNENIEIAPSYLEWQTIAISLFVSVLVSLITISVTQWISNKELNYKEGLKMISRDLEEVWNIKAASQIEFNNQNEWFNYLIPKTHSLYASYINTADYLTESDIRVMNRLSMSFVNGPLNKFISILSVNETYNHEHNEMYGMACLGFLDEYQSVLTRNANYKKKVLLSNYRKNRTNFRTESLLVSRKNYEDKISSIKSHFQILHDLFSYESDKYDDKSLYRLHSAFKYLNEVYNLIVNDDQAFELCNIKEKYNLNIIKGYSQKKDVTNLSKEIILNFISTCNKYKTELICKYLEYRSICLRIGNEYVLINISEDLSISIAKIQKRDIKKSSTRKV
jgi:hypothetical protein